MCSEIKVLTKDHQKEWLEVLERMYAYDFYHTYSYNYYYSDRNSFPILFCFNKSGIELAIPLIVRKIEKTNYYDVTSSYGYVGPLSSQPIISDEIVDEFLKALNKYFIDNKIISAFSRLHPSLKNENLLQGLGTVLPLSQTVYINLKNSLEIQRKDFKKGVKADLSKLSKGDFLVFEDEKKQFISEFIDIYNENMERVGAKSEYFFQIPYYNAILKSKDVNSKLYFVIKDGIKIAASIFVFTGNIIQYHLSATRFEYLKNSPVRLLIDHVRKYGFENGFHELHLGGGVGSVEDSLFKFKSGFSENRYQFKVWRYVVNQHVYDELVQKNGDIKDPNYFPLYRSI